MLDKLGSSKVQSAVLGTVVVLMCAIFILQFGGPQARGCTAARGIVYAAEVNGTTISEGEFRAAFTLAGGNRYPVELARQSKLREHVLDGLIERELLAREAERLGFRTTRDDVMKRLADEGTIYLSKSVNAPQDFPGGIIRLDGIVYDEHHVFDLEQTRRWIQNSLRRSVQEFADSQVRETLAQRMRETITATVTVSQDEVWDTYAREKDSATVKYVRFSPLYYHDALQVTDADLTAWMAAHTHEVDQEYTRQRHRFTGLEREVHARHILVKVAGDATDEVRAAARARAQDLLRRVRAGEDFAALARQYSDDTGSARLGGDLHWNPRGRMVAPFDTAQFALQPGQVSDLVETDFGYHIIKVEGAREGDVPEADAKRELSEDLYRTAKAGELARDAAARALTELRAGTTLDQLDTELAPPPPPPNADGTVSEPAEDPYRPHLQETRPFGRSDAPIPGPFDSGPLARAAFALSLDHPLPAEPLRLGEDYVVFQLTEKTQATRDDFPVADRDRITQGLVNTKMAEVLGDYVRHLRHVAQTEGTIRINEEVLQYGEDDASSSGEGEG